MFKSQPERATALNTINYHRPFGLSTDASALVVGCCLFQWDDEGQAPIAFWSLKLSTTQTRWSTIEREAFAVVWVLNKFRSWVLLSKIIEFSDHQPLAFLTNAASKVPNCPDGQKKYLICHLLCKSITWHSSMKRHGEYRSRFLFLVRLWVGRLVGT